MWVRTSYIYFPNISWTPWVLDAITDPYLGPSSWLHPVSFCPESVCAIWHLRSDGHWLQFDAAGVPELGCGEEGNFSANSSILMLMAVSAARPLGSSVLFQVNHEAAPLWVSPMVLLLSCESIMVVRGPWSEAAPGQVPPHPVLLSVSLLFLVWSCHFLSARLHLQTKKRTLEKVSLLVRRSGWVSREKASGVVTRAV